MFVKKIAEMEEPPLPDNLKRIHILHSTGKYCKQINEYLKFMKEDIKKINQQLFGIIMNYLINIIKYNSLEEIEFVFTHIKTNIVDMIKDINLEDKDKLLTLMSVEVVNLVNKSLTDFNNIFKIINVLKFTDPIINQPTHKEIITMYVSKIVESEDMADSIQLNIDTLIRELNVKTVLKLLNFISNIKNRDVFVNKYYQYLIKRLTEQVSNFESTRTIPKEYIQIEKNVYEFLKNKFGDKLVYKLGKVIIDTESSFEDNYDFNEIVPSVGFDNKMTVITTSFNNWDINQTEGLVNEKIVGEISHTQLGTHLKNYQKFYELRYANKRLINWFPHFGEVNITWLNKEILMLPIQFMVMEMFNDQDRVPIQTIFKAPFFSNYTAKFVQGIVGSLVSSRLFHVQNDYMILNSSDNFNTNLIDVFFNTSDYAQIWEQKRCDELALSREEIVCANINHKIKIQSMTKTQLFDNVAKTIDIFKLDQITFDKAIDHMCKMDYIILNDDKYEKITC
jgi:hypothetical protein